MNSKKTYFLLLATAGVLTLLLLGSAFMADMVLSTKTDSLSKLKAEDEALSDLQIALIRDKSDVKRYAELNQIAKAIVPQDKDQTQTVREIVNIARANGINKLTSVTFPASTLGTAGAAGAASTGGITQVTPVKGMSGVYALPITVANDQNDSVLYTKFIAFLAGLEQNRRTAQVTSITITPDPTNSSYISFSLTINEYIKP